MDKKKVKIRPRTTTTTNGHKKKRERDQKNAKGSRRFRTRVESSLTKRTKNRYSSSLYAPLALSPQREEEEEEEVRVFACRAAFCFRSFFARRKRMRTMSNHLGIARRVARVARAIFWMRNESIRRLRGGGGLLCALPPREEKNARVWTRHERGARQNSGELRGDVRFAR